MRSFRTIVLGCAVAALALGALASPAFAVKEKLVFGKFVASTTGSDKGHGEVGEMKLGPYIFTGKNNGKGSHGPICEKELKSTGEVMAGEHEELEQNIKFSKCIATRKAGSAEEAVSFHFTLGVEFHSNHSATLGEGASEAVILPSSIIVKGKKSECTLVIPGQTVPVAAERNPEKEFEVASYETEKESTAGERGKEMKFGPFHERLDIEMEFKKIKTELKIEPEKGCTDEKLEEGSKFNPEKDTVEFTNGILEAELEEVTLKNGNLSFVPAM